MKQYGQLYLDTRHALLETEDAQTAGMMARQLLKIGFGGEGTIVQ